MMVPKKLFFDEMLDVHTKDLNDFEKEYEEFVRSGLIRQDFITMGQKYFDHAVRGLRDSKVFLLNGAVVDDLYNIPHDSTNYQASMHMPFPIIFFELMDPMPIQTDLDKTRPLRGMLFGKSVAMTYDPQGWAYDDQFSAYLFYGDRQRFMSSDFVEFRISRLPEIRFQSDDKIYTYSPNEGVFDDNSAKRQFLSEVGPLLTISEHQNPKIPGETFRGLLDLSVNLIDYVNAHNIVLRQEFRETRNIDAINRKRLAKGKRPLDPLKPYYWIEVKQSQTGTNNDSESKMDYREWVRGHFHRYHTTKGLVKNWVNPYVRGPEGAQWKENRYKVLADMLLRDQNFR